MRLTLPKKPEPKPAVPTTLTYDLDAVVLPLDPRNPPTEPKPKPPRRLTDFLPIQPPKPVREPVLERDVQLPNILAPPQRSENDQARIDKRFKALRKLISDEDLQEEQALIYATFMEMPDYEKRIADYNKRMLARINISRSRIGAIIANQDVFLVGRLLELAKGITVREIDRDGKERIYDKPPDREAIMYLLDKIIPKAALTAEDAGARQVAQVQIFLPHNNREDVQILEAEIVDLEPDCD